VGILHQLVVIAGVAVTLEIAKVTPLHEVTGLASNVIAIVIALVAGL
jgi:hypothetical protein